jgi:hypothetical protein
VVISKVKNKLENADFTSLRDYIIARGGTSYSATVKTGRAQGQPTRSYHKPISKIRLEHFLEFPQLLPGNQ